MFDVNVDKINGKCAEKRITKSQLAKTLGVSEPTLRKYLTDPKSMPYSVMDNLADVICDSHAEAKDIFFCRNLRKT